MITLNVLGFIAVIAVALVFGAVLTLRVHRASIAQDAAVARFLRDVAVNDEADMGECR